MNAPLPRRSLRAALPDEPRAPLQLEGRRRAQVLTAYYAFHAFIFAGLAYTLSWSPGLLLFSLALCYVGENVLFVIAHVGLHAVFMEAREAEMATISHHGFTHHYRDARALHKAWLSTRVGYFICLRHGFRKPTPYVYLLAPLISAGLIAAVDWRVALCALCCTWAAHALQSVGHEWYHNDDREGFYWWPTRRFLSGMERVGLMSTKQHRRHHRHHLHNLDAVQDWADLYVPGLERLGQTAWAWALAQHVPGERRMLRAVRSLALTYYPLHFAAVTGVFLAIARA